MTARTTTEAFADAAAAIVEDLDISHVLARLLSDCAGLVHADAIGLMVLAESGELELLSATSHGMAQLELFQIQRSDGPCIEGVKTGDVTVATSREEIRGRWGNVGEAIADAGFQTVMAFPMRWHGRILGGLNVFKREPGGKNKEDLLLGQAFADLSTAILIQTRDIAAEDITARVRHAIAARSTIEQAKGVLAHKHNLEMDQAYDKLVEKAHAGESTLSEAAAAVVRQAYR